MSYNSVINSTDKSTFKNMIEITKRCLVAKGANSSFGEKLKCETAYFSQENNYTYHTHPCGSPEPSQADIDTTNKFHKKFMFIGLVPTNKVVVYGAHDNFKNMIGSFQV